MASTAEPPTEPRTEREEPLGEMSPLIDRPWVRAGFGRQTENGHLLWNLYIGLGWIAQLGLFGLVLVVAIPIMENPILLFSGHPLAQVIGISTLIQSIMVLQPTRSDKQKVDGQRGHALFHIFSFLSFVAGITFIECHKFYNGLKHLHSAHAYIGVVTCGVLVIQYLFGVTMWAVPWLYGGVDNAKRLWKFHRWSGYLIVLLLLASVISATRTDYVRDVLKIKTVYMSIVAFLIICGIVPRISRKKLGLKKR